MSRTDKINLLRTELLDQYSKLTGESSVEHVESIFTDEVVACAMDLGLCLS